MNTTTYILSASTKREAIVSLIYHNFKAGKQSFSAPSLSLVSTIQIQISALIQTTYCRALKSLSHLNYECVKTHSFIHIWDMKKNFLSHETAFFEIKYNKLFDLTREFEW